MILDLDLSDCVIDRNKKYLLITGTEAFRLQSTHGVPLQVIVDIAYKYDAIVDLVGYRAEMKKHKRISRGD